MIMGMQLIDDVFEDHLGGRKGDHVPGNPVVSSSVSVKEVGFHPSRVARVLHKKVIKVGMVSYPLHDQIPIAKAKNKMQIQ